MAGAARGTGVHANTVQFSIGKVERDKVGRGCLLCLALQWCVRHRLTGRKMDQ